MYCNSGINLVGVICIQTNHESTELKGSANEGHLAGCWLWTVGLSCCTSSSTLRRGGERQRAASAVSRGKGDMKTEFQEIFNGDGLQSGGCYSKGWIDGILGVDDFLVVSPFFLHFLPIVSREG
ncbi:hypothetical protein BVRB_2g045960 [Beta vulgaris subsp. vulgaris]|nr:hypothetical protein BVRB_2g045960 [Beta vulgaris subsp. vulgaris]